MEHEILIREAQTEADIAAFWAQLYAYFQRDLFPDPADEDLAYFLGPEYRAQVEQVHARPQDSCHYLFFRRDGQDVGFAMPVIYHTEDGKCFVMEFCVFPAFRGGTGTACAAALLRWAKAQGAAYLELNYGGDPRRLRFWQRMGFVRNGMDQWGAPLLLLPPEEERPVTVEILSDPEDWQLLKLENGFLAEVGEAPLTEEKQAQLQQAVRDGNITFFLAKRGYRAVGMCSVSPCFSTFSCGQTGVFEDFYIEPVFRKHGIARKLAQAAQAWCRAREMASLTVCCAPCDEGMYQALGFAVRLGTTLAHLPASDAIREIREDKKKA